MMRTLTPILSIIIALLLFLFFIKPQYSEITLLQTEIDEYTNAVESYNDFIAVLDGKLRIKNSRASSDSERLDKLVRTDIDDTRLIVDLEAMVEKHNMLFGNVISSGNDAELSSGGTDPAQAQSEELRIADITFDVIGTYEQFKDFLKDLESSLTIYEVINLAFNVTEGTFQQFSVKVRSYALPK